MGRCQRGRSAELEITPSCPIPVPTFLIEVEIQLGRKKNICILVALSVRSHSYFMRQLCLTYKVRVKFLFVCRPSNLYLFGEGGCWQLWPLRGTHLALDLELSLRLCLWIFFFFCNCCCQYKKENLGINTTTYCERNCLLPPVPVLKLSPCPTAPVPQ